jgi:transcriptional regulator with XRE-family HTH domain
MLDQPRFGQHLKRLRLQRDLSQLALAGDGMSTAYLSRLESGKRQPTERAISYLAQRLGVEVSVLLQPGPEPLAQVVASAVSAPVTVDTVQVLRQALAEGGKEDPAARWQALWLLVRALHEHGDYEAESQYLPELVQLSDAIAVPELQTRARTQHSVCLRATGALREALPLADEAFEIARRGRLGIEDTAGALMVLISLQTETDAMAPAMLNVALLDKSLDEMSNPLKTEVLWTGAIIRLRTGDYATAIERLERAMAALDSAEDVSLWARVRLATSSVALRMTPPRSDLARVRLAEAAAAIALVGTPLRRQELTLLEADLAFHDGRYEVARGLCAQLNDSDLRLSYRDRVQLRSLEARLLILGGDVRGGTQLLEELGQEVTDNKNPALAAQVWQSLALTLSSLQPPPIQSRQTDDDES